MDLVIFTNCYHFFADLSMQYGCCLSMVGSSEDQMFFRESCTLGECPIVAGGSPSHLVTPFLVIMMLLFVVSVI